MEDTELGHGVHKEEYVFCLCPPCLSSVSSVAHALICFRYDALTSLRRPQLLQPRIRLAQVFRHQPTDFFAGFALLRFPIIDVR